MLTTYDRLESTLSSLDFAIQELDDRGPVLHAAIARQLRLRREHPAEIGLKINLYTRDEVEGLAIAVNGRDRPVECAMVGDSYFNTHLGMQTTRLSTPEEREWGMSTIEALVVEVRAAMDHFFNSNRCPFLMADLPDGAAATPSDALRSAGRLVEAGADSIKIEIGSSEAFRCVEACARFGMVTVAHLGFTPQTSEVGRRGDSVEDALALFAAARRARDAGASLIVLEMTSEFSNALLSVPRVGALPVYSIFSGRARGGGQSLNVWDSVFVTRQQRKFFPPTASLNVERERDQYTPPLIADHLGRLIDLTMAGSFPRRPSSRLSSADQAFLNYIDPWSENAPITIGGGWRT